MKGRSKASNFIRHWVRVRIDGYRPERLISEALGKNIPIKDISHGDETEVTVTIAKADLADFKKLAKSKYRVTTVREGGVGATAMKVAQNRLLPIGVVIFIAVYVIQFQFVKEIQVLGCEQIPEDSLRTLLEEEGLYEGGRKTFDCDQIEKKIFAEYPFVVWAKVSYRGTYVQVEISEGEIKGEEVLNRENPCDLVAEQDCYIENVETYKGRSQVEPGEFVEKGGILIAGTVPLLKPTFPVEEGDELVHYVHAEGRVVARVPYHFSFYLEADAQKYEISAAVRRWTKKNIPENAEILNKDFHFDKKKNIIKVYGTIETRQNVGVEKEIVIDYGQNAGNEENTD